MALRGFKSVCTDFGVAHHNVRILATEATRTALNSVEYRRKIQDATGWPVEMLGKEEEGEVGAFGVASSFANVRGLVMDLGGGSMQITWMIAHEGQLRTSPNVAVSFPYGAAAMTKRLADAEKDKSEDEAEKAKDLIRQEMKSNFQSAYDSLQIPPELIDAAKADGGFTLYLSGGGFRGWGYLLLSQNQEHDHHYPISIINGFWAKKDDFQDTKKLKEIAKQADKIFRVSDRRRKQVPAVAFLINVLADSLPHGIKEARFCQGGVREGILFRDLPVHIRAQDPLVVATAPYACPSASALHALLLAAFPVPLEPPTFPPAISNPLIRAFTNMLFQHAELSKESASVAALYSTSTGILASAHGVSHSDRALLALMLEDRFEGELPPRDARMKYHLTELVSAEESWWCRYIGTVAWFVCEVYPAGVVDEVNPRIRLKAEWMENEMARSEMVSRDRNKKIGEGEGEGDGDGGNEDDDRVVHLTITVPKAHSGHGLTQREVLEANAKVVKKVGKEKNWIGGPEGWGLEVQVEVVIEGEGDS
jgi:retrograde regulation protein 2